MVLSAMCTIQSKNEVIRMCHESVAIKSKKEQIIDQNMSSVFTFVRTLETSLIGDYTSIFWNFIYHIGQHLLYM